MDYGIGMGLSCSYEIAKAMGGEVSLISSVQGNTIFEIKLPVNLNTIIDRNDSKISIDVSNINRNISKIDLNLSVKKNIDHLED